MSACENGGTLPLVPFPLLGPTHTTPLPKSPTYLPLKKKLDMGDGEGSWPEEDPFLWH